MFNIIQKRKWWYGISLAALIPGFIMLMMGGLRPGIDFTGGSLLRVGFTGIRPTAQDVTKSLQGILSGDFFAQPIEKQDIVIRGQDISEVDQAKVVEKLSGDFGGAHEVSFESIGPTVGKELRQKSITAMVVVLFFIILYISFAFRKVSIGPVRPWTYGVMAVLALIHDVLFVVGAFAIMGYFFKFEIDSLFVTALLTTLGFSVHDTIVVFDRIRERLRTNPAETYEMTVNESINQTLVRSLNTSLITLLVLISLYFFGGDTIRNFVLALILGISVGTYSSIFVASPLLVTWEKFTSRK